MNVYMNVLVLLPRLPIPIHFCSANSSSLQIIFTFPIRIWVISSSKKTHFFGCDVVSPTVPNCSGPWFTLVSCFAPPLEVWPRNHRETREIPSEKIPSKTGVEKKLVWNGKREQPWNAAMVTRCDLVRPGDLGGAGGELLGCPVGSWYQCLVNGLFHLLINGIYWGYITHWS